MKLQYIAHEGEGILESEKVCGKWILYMVSTKADRAYSKTQNVLLSNKMDIICKQLCTY